MYFHHVTLICLLLVAPVYLHPHRFQIHNNLNLEQSTESSIQNDAPILSETTAAPMHLFSMAQHKMEKQQRRKYRNVFSDVKNLVMETLNSPVLIITNADVVAANNVYNNRKPAFSQQKNQQLHTINSNNHYSEAANTNENIYKKNELSEENQVKAIVNAFLIHNKRNAKSLDRQLYPLVALKDESKIAIWPLSWNWRESFDQLTPSTIYASTQSKPLRIWAIGSVAKFPPFLEHFLQRIQSYYSIYKYDDLSRPAFTANEVVHHGNANGNESNYDEPEFSTITTDLTTTNDPDSDLVVKTTTIKTTTDTTAETNTSNSMHILKG